MGMQIPRVARSTGGIHGPIVIVRFYPRSVGQLGVFIDRYQQWRESIVGRIVLA